MKNGTRGDYFTTRSQMTPRPVGSLASVVALGGKKDGGVHFEGPWSTYLPPGSQASCGSKGLLGGPKENSVLPWGFVRKRKPISQGLPPLK